MTSRKTRSITALLLTLALTLSLLCAGMVPASAAGALYRFDAAGLTAAADKEALTGGSFADGYIATFGELVKRTSSDGAVKSVEIGKNGSSGLTFTAGGAADVAVEFSSTGGSNSSTVGLWNDKDQLVANNEGVSVVSGTDKVKLTWTALPAGTYKVVSPDASEHNRGARVYTLSVEDSAGARAPRLDWAAVARPVIDEAVVDGGTVTIRYTVAVGYDGADSVSVAMTGPESAVADGLEGKAVFAPTQSGAYSFTVIASREGGKDKSTLEPWFVNFVLPLAVPTMSTAASAGGGKVKITWNAVAEATGYNVYLDGQDRPVNAAPVTATEFELPGLVVNSTHTFAVSALRGKEETAPSAALTAVATQEAQQAWAFATFGVSTRPEKNYSEGDLNRDGKVRVISGDGAGKILANSTDGIAFYYTAIPVNKNFTLRAKVHVNAWENRSAQNGFGVAALDRVGTESKEFWNNSVLAGGMRYAYYYDSATGIRYAEEDPNRLGDKYNMRLGLASLVRSGVTHAGLDAMGGEITSPPGFATSTQPLEFYALDEGKAPGTYNLVANGAALECDELSATLADYILEVRRNNTGYFTSYYDLEGNLVKQNKTYDPKILDRLDTEYVYAGVFTSRLMDATFSDVELKINDPSADPAPEAKPKTEIMPKVLINSAEVENSGTYGLIVTANVAGEVRTTVNGGSGPSGKLTDPAGRCDIAVTLEPGKNDLTVTLLPDPAQTFADPDTALGSTEPVTAAISVTYDDRLSGRKLLYVSPAGTPEGDGSRTAPLDLYTAVDLAAAGQTIVVTEGRYILPKTLNIKKGMDGTEDAPIYMVADPAALTRPVLDFDLRGGGIKLDANWWYLYGLDVTRGTGEGVNIAGSHNTLDQVDSYYNQATGVQISRSSRADYNIDYWPGYNTILNCTSYGNADPGYSDADGFGAKLTAGRGNVFDGCVAHHNSDDGWDLYAKAEQGPIGTVIVKNCVAYENGILEDGTNAGDGNGFKMGGESITGYHELRDCLSFFNKNCGVTTNSCPDLQVYDVTAFDNGHLNINFYTKLAKNTDFGCQGFLSLRTAPTPGQWDQFAPTGSQDPAKVLNDANYFWNVDHSANQSGTKTGLEAVVSTEFAGFTRKADGTLDLGDFLKRSDTAPAGADLGGTPSLSLASLDLPWEAGPLVSFVDVPAGHWAQSAVSAMAERGILKGVDETKRLFDPASPVTRASVAVILWRLAGEPELDAKPDGVPPTPDYPLYDDLALDSWYIKAVRWCTQQDIVRGKDGGRFGPDDAITRQELAVMLARYAAAKDLPAGETAAEFVDGDAVAPWASEGVTWCVSRGILQGKDGGRLDPAATVTRAETAVMAWRFAALLEK